MISGNWKQWTANENAADVFSDQLARGGGGGGGHFLVTG